MITDREEFIAHPNVYLPKIKKGSLFVYPTDTIYGIGCIATSKKAVEKLRNVTGKKHPVSVIAPSKQWIRENCVMTDRAQTYIKELPGALTLIMKLKNKKAVAANVGKSGTVGVRIPDHWISFMVKYLGKPIVTTSANVTGKPYMTKLEDMDRRILKAVDFIVYEGNRGDAPSKIIDVTGKKAIVTKRKKQPKDKKVVIYTRRGQIKPK